MGFPDCSVSPENSPVFTLGAFIYIMMRTVSLLSGLVVVLQVVTGHIVAKGLVGKQICSWEGHCAGGLALMHQSLHLVVSLTKFLGANCETENDCDGDLICRAGECSSSNVRGGGGRGRTSTSRTPIPTPTQGSGCSWEGHCLGIYCFVSPSTCRPGFH